MKTIRNSNMKAKSITTTRSSSSTACAIALLFLWTTHSVVSAFASSHHHHSSLLPFHSIASDAIHESLHDKLHGRGSAGLHFVHHQYNRQRPNGRSTTHLHLSIPRGGGAIIASATSQFAEWTSTPSGTFNVALALLAMSTAVLKVYNRVEQQGDGKEGGEVVS